MCLVASACAAPQMATSPAALSQNARVVGSKALVETAPCAGPSAYQAAAAYNEAALRDLPFAPFGRPETGWAIYAPLAMQTVGSACGPQTAGFAAVLARWQSLHGSIPNGALTSDSFQVLKGVWQESRPFVMLRAAGVCPPGVDEARLETLPVDATLGGKLIRLRPAAAAALSRMVQAAREEDPQIAADPLSLAAFSGYRSPEADAVRCKGEGNCQGLVRAQCSAHRTGLAVDLDVGAAPGFLVDSSDDANRLFQSQTPAYRWLVRNAARFGFVNYAFEPWHWEWTGESP
jgi:hypothetical protein